MPHQLTKEMPPVTAQTLDQVLDQVDRAVILKRFDAVRKQANAFDAERDRLRDYIKKMAAGNYDGVLLNFKPAGTRYYANSAGLASLQVSVIVAPSQHNDTVECAFGDEVTVRNAKGEIVFRGTLVDNTTLYTGGPVSNIQVTELPQS